MVDRSSCNLRNWQWGTRLTTHSIYIAVCGNGRDSQNYKDWQEPPITMLSLFFAFWWGHREVSQSRYKEDQWPHPCVYWRVCRATTCLLLICRIWRRHGGWKARLQRMLSYNLNKFATKSKKSRHFFFGLRLSKEILNLVVRISDAIFLGLQFFCSIN